MFDELDKYENNDHFFFEAHQSLERKCNAPKDKGGVFLVYALKGGKIELVYIGSTGGFDVDDSIWVAEEGLGGLLEEIVNGTSFEEIPNSIAWPAQMAKENIEALDISWHVTHDGPFNDSPELVEDSIVETYFEVYGQMPRWNHGI
jgi:hypothetical protein